MTALLSGVWLVIALALRRGYVQAITDSIQQYRLDVERASAPVLDRSAASALVGTLEAADSETVLYALRAFELEHRGVPHPAVRALLGHESAKVRARALALLNNTGDRSVIDRVEPLLQDADLNVRTQALLYLAYHARIDPLERIQTLGDFPGYSIRAGMVAFLSQPGRLQNIDAARVLLDGMVHESGEAGKPARLEAATLLAHLPNEFGAELGRLVEDEDHDVARAALGSLAELGRRDLAHLAIDRLADPALGEAARAALAALGAGVLPVLAVALGRSDVPIERRRAIPPIVAQIGTDVGQRVLVDNLLQQDVTLRMRVIGALNTLHKLHQDIDIDRQAVEMVLMAEIMGHYRSYQILGSLGDALGENEPVALALHASMQQEVERIFRLMGLRWPEFDMHSAYIGLTSRNPTIRANALEFLDNTLKPQVRSLVVPLLDVQVPIEERVRLADQVLGTTVDTHEQAVAALLASDDSWLRTCGVYAVGLLRIESLAPELDRLTESGDPLLAETARAAKARLAGEPAAEPRHQPEPSPAWPAQEGMGVG
jgi:AAA family ATP:ADP antiporter